MDLQILTLRSLAVCRSGGTLYQWRVGAGGRVVGPSFVMKRRWEIALSIARAELHHVSKRARQGKQLHRENGVGSPAPARKRRLYFTPDVIP